MPCIGASTGAACRPRGKVERSFTCLMPQDWSGPFACLSRSPKLALRWPPSLYRADRHRGGSRLHERLRSNSGNRIANQIASRNSAPTARSRSFCRSFERACRPPSVTSEALVLPCRRPRQYGKHGVTADPDPIPEEERDNDVRLVDANVMSDRSPRARALGAHGSAP